MTLYEKRRSKGGSNADIKLEKIKMARLMEEEIRRDKNKGRGLQPHTSPVQVCAAWGGGLEAYTPVDLPIAYLPLLSGQGLVPINLFYI